MGNLRGWVLPVTIAMVSSAWSGTVIHSERAHFDGGYHTGWGMEPVSGDLRLGARGAEVLEARPAGSLPSSVILGNVYDAAAWQGRIYALGSPLFPASPTPIASAAINADGSLGAWTMEANPLPEHRKGAAMTAWNGRLYVVSGRDGASMANGEVFSAPLGADGAVGVWRSEPYELPVPRVQFKLVAWNGRLYAVAGYEGTGPAQGSIYSAPVHGDGSVGPWSPEAMSLPASISAHGVALWNGRMYVSGGTGAPLGEVRSTAFNPDGSLGAWRAETALPTPIIQHGMAVWNGRLYVMNGRDGAGDSDGILSARLDPVTGAVGTWTRELSGLLALPSVVVVAWAGRCYVVPATTERTVYVVALNRAGDLSPWAMESTALPGPRLDHAMVAWNGRLYVAGGMENITFNTGYQAGVHSAPVGSDGTVGPWRNETSLPQQRRGLAMAAWKGRLYVAGGYPPTGAYLRSVISSSIQGDGSLGPWRTEPAALPAGLLQPVMKVWNGRLYAVDRAVQSPSNNKVYSAPVLADGSVGPWVTEPSSLPQGRVGARLEALNGNLYVLGGSGGPLASDADRIVFHASINLDGSVGPWQYDLTNLLPEEISQAGATGAWDGRLIVLNGNKSGAPFKWNVYSARINADGSHGPWTAEPAASPSPQEALLQAVSVWNGRLYVSGGSYYTSGSSAVYSSGLSRFADAGDYFSPVVDLGSPHRLVRSVSWGESGGASDVGIVLSTGGAWSAFAPVSNGAGIGLYGRYLQYKVDMAPDPSGLQTPSVDDVSIVHDPDIVDPARSPEQLAATAVTSTSVSLSFFDRSFLETSFLISTGTVSGPANDAASWNGPTDSSGTVVSGTLTGLTPDTEYYIRVRAHDAVESVYGLFSDEIVIRTLPDMTAALPPARPKNLRVR